MRAGFEGVREKINGHAADSHLPHCSPESSEEDDEEEEESAAVEREERERPAGRATLERHPERPRHRRRPPRGMNRCTKML